MNLIVTKKTTFSYFVQKNGFEDLIREMKSVLFFS